MAIRDAKPEHRDGRGGGMKVEIDDSDNPPTDKPTDPPAKVTGK